MVIGENFVALLVLNNPSIQKDNFDMGEHLNNEQMEAESSSSTKPKTTKHRPHRNTDHKVLRIETGEANQQEDKEDYQERKTRGKRERKRKAPAASSQQESDTIAAAGVAADGAETGEDMDTGETKAKKPFFARLSGQQEMVSQFYCHSFELT